MVQRVSTVAFEGIEARAVDVQVQVAPGLPAFAIAECECQGYKPRHITQERAMEHRNTSITVLALRTTVRLAWGMARAAKALGDAGEALENAVDRQARKHRVDIMDVLEPLVAAHGTDRA